MCGGDGGPVLIFGATGGIGGALARLLAGRGASVHLAGRDAARLAALAAELGGGAGFTAGDVLVEEDVARAVREAAEAGGGSLSGLAFAVGSIDLLPLRRATPDRFAAAFALNVTAAAGAVRHAQAALAAGGGAVVLFSSVAAGTGFRNHAVTGTAKAAVEGLTRALAAELAPKVRVNCIAPTLTRTPLAAPLLASPQAADAIARQHPLGRLGEAGDVAAVAAALLSSESAGYVTGQVVHVDGGRGALASP
jgi:NAD(P)-dependent dehydrogenase (short-subunit alcohol dehydrogenase family)